MHSVKNVSIITHYIALQLTSKKLCFTKNPESSRANMVATGNAEFRTKLINFLDSPEKNPPGENVQWSNFFLYTHHEKFKA